MTSYLTVLVVVAMAAVISCTPVDTDKPAFSCPENEQYYKCSQIHCYKNCDHLKKPPACPSVTSDCYNPACECVNNYLRNKDGVCISINDCYPGEGYNYFSS